MATDNIKQLGKIFRKSFQNIDTQTKRYHENFPKLEQTRDIISSRQPYYHTFNADPRNSARLNLIFKPDFDPSIVDTQIVKIAITETGLPIGKAGQVGECGYWYQLAYMGDLSLSGTSSSYYYKAVFTYETYGSADYTFRLQYTPSGGSDPTQIDYPSSWVTMGGGTITLPIYASLFGLSTSTILRDVYIYSRADNCTASSWIYISGASFYFGPATYVPKVISDYATRVEVR